MRWMLSILCTVAFLGARSEMLAGELVSPKGFAVTYPEEWKPLPQEQVDLIAKKAVGSQAGLVCAVIQGPVQAGFNDNVNVVVVPEAVTLDAEREEAMVGVLKAALGKNGKEFRQRRTEINGKPALAIAYEVEGQPMSEPIRLWQVYIPGKEKMYVFTCTTLKSRWNDLWPDFKAIVHSARIDVSP